jgi:hypothetical protein
MGQNLKHLHFTIPDSEQSVFGIEQRLLNFCLQTTGKLNVSVVWMNGTGLGIENRKGRESCGSSVNRTPSASFYENGRK